MNRWWVMVLLIGLTGCADEPGSAPWCETKGEQSKSEWSMDDAATYAAHCVLDSTTIGSKSWCADLDKTDKGNWSANEASSYAKYCIVN